MRCRFSQHGGSRSSKEGQNQPEAQAGSTAFRYHHKLGTESLAHEPAEDISDLGVLESPKTLPSHCLLDATV